MKNIIFILVLIVSCCPLSNANSLQDSIPDWAITWSPSALLNTFQGIQFGFEKHLGAIERKGVNEFIELEAAYIPKQSRYTPGSELYKEGVRLKLGYKQVYKGGFLFSSTLYVRRSQHQHRGFVFVDESYFEEFDYRKVRTLIGPTFGLGYSHYTKEGVGMDFGLNLGLGMYMIRFRDFPENGLENQGTFGYDAEGNYTYLIIGLSFKVKFSNHYLKFLGAQFRKK